MDLTKFELIERDFNIVLVGSFNPAIFHPEWLARNGLISSADLENAQVEVVHPDLARFSVGWAKLEVVKERFVVRTHDPSFQGPMRDLAVGIFSILGHTPIKNLGVNAVIKVQAPDEATWHQVGDALAPKEIWSKSLVGRVGLKRLSVKAERDDGLDGEVNVDVAALSDPVYGIALSINNHLVLKDEPKFIETVLMDHWDRLQENAEAVFKNTLEEATK